MHPYFYSVKKDGLITVALALEATVASSTGNFETKARSLGMRPEGAAAVLRYFREVHSQLLTHKLTHKIEMTFLRSMSTRNHTGF